MFNIIESDLIKLAKEGRFDFIAHGCNCFNRMGGGIAKQIAREFPEAYEVDTDYFNTMKYACQHPRMLGSISRDLIIRGGIKFFVENWYTQYHLGDDFRYEALESCIARFTEYSAKAINRSRKLSLGVPLIGGGIGGGEKKKIINIFEKAFKQNENFNVTLVLWSEHKQ